MAISFRHQLFLRRLRKNLKAFTTLYGLIPLLLVAILIVYYSAQLLPATVEKGPTVNRGIERGSNPLIKPSNQLTGIVSHVRDADTIEVAGTAIRLNGVDSPESNHPIYSQAKAYMRDLVLGKNLRCKLNGERAKGREVGVCYLNGKDIGREVISAGYALDCPRYSGGRYKKYEKKELRELYGGAPYC